jgi:hypothetical protein
MYQHGVSIIIVQKIMYMVGSYKANVGLLQSSVFVECTESAVHADVVPLRPRGGRTAGTVATQLSHRHLTHLRQHMIIIYANNNN